MRFVVQEVRGGEENGQDHQICVVELGDLAEINKLIEE